MYRVKTSPLADLDLEHIEFDGAVQFGHAQAMKYLDGLDRLFGNLAHFPMLGSDLQSARHPGWRKFPYGCHIVIYSVAGSDVIIRRVLSARMNWMDHLS